MPAPRPCPLCRAAHGEETDRPMLARTGLVSAFPDAYPSADGHILVVPARHVARLADLLPAESTALWSTAMRLLADLQQREPELNFTVGVNDGPAAGQTVAHVHLHIIPRRRGDTPDPRGGIRWVLPDTAPYWQS